MNSLSLKSKCYGAPPTTTTRKSPILRPSAMKGPGMLSTESSDIIVTSRRELFLGVASVSLMSFIYNPSPVIAQSPVDWAAVRKDILSVMSDEKGITERGPTLVRLAWHSSGTYDKMSRTGGSGLGTIRFKEELSHGANAGLDKAVAWLEPVKSKRPDISYADLFTLAGVVAIEAMGGPEIKWRAGRVDAMDPSQVTPDGRLPEADSGSPPKTAAQLRSVFGRMGFGDQEIVALSGAHALGRCHAENSGYVGPWTPTPTTFNNLYFQLLLKANWVPDDRQKQLQYREVSGSLMMLPSDLVLIQDPDFKVYVEQYAKGKKGQKAFFNDFAAAFNKLEELGTKNLYEV